MKIGIFDDRVEKIVIWLPTILFGFALAELLLVFDLKSGLNRYWLLIVTNVLFFNVTHTPFTFEMLARIPEFKSFRLKWIKLLLIYFGLVTFFYFNLHISNQWRVVLSVSLYAIPFYHTLYQFRGLSLCYNQILKREFNLEFSHRIRLSERLERIGFRLFLMTSTTTGATYIWDLLSEDLVWLRWVGWGATVISLSILYTGVFLFPRLFESNKPIYVIRILIFLTMPFSVIGSAAQSIAHGVEYMAVVNRMVSNSSATKKSFFLPAAIWLVGFGAAYALAIHWVSDPQWSGEVYSSSASLLYSMIFAVIFLHYYVDRHLFRMRIPATRAMVAPLLLPCSPPQTAKSHPPSRQNDGPQL